MAIRSLRGTTPSSRFATTLKNNFTSTSPEKTLIKILKKNSGRDVRGHISMRHQGGRHKRFIRMIDFKRDKKNIPGRVIGFEYDPNRSANIALIHYQDGEKRYILAPEALKLNDIINSSLNAEIKVGNCLPVGKMPVGTIVHNIEVTPGKGGQLIRSAGAGAVILAREKDFVQLKMPSGEVRLISIDSWATIGMIGNIDWKNIVFGKAGRKRHMGIRPTVRGTAQNPRTHPHGGGEGRSGEGLKYAKTPWGKNARGKRTRKGKKYSDKYIISRRKQ